MDPKHRPHRLQHLTSRRKARCATCASGKDGEGQQRMTFFFYPSATTEILCRRNIIGLHNRHHPDQAPDRFHWHHFRGCSPRA